MIAKIGAMVSVGGYEENLSDDRKVFLGKCPAEKGFWFLKFTNKEAITNVKLSDEAMAALFKIYICFDQPESGWVHVPSAEEGT